MIRDQIPKAKPKTSFSRANITPNRKPKPTFLSDHTKINFLGPKLKQVSQGKAKSKAKANFLIFSQSKANAEFLEGQDKAKLKAKATFFFDLTEMNFH